MGRHTKILQVIPPIDMASHHLFPTAIKYLVLFPHWLCQRGNNTRYFIAAGNRRWDSISVRGITCNIVYISEEITCEILYVSEGVTCGILWGSNLWDFTCQWGCNLWDFTCQWRSNFVKFQWGSKSRYSICQWGRNFSSKPPDITWPVLWAHMKVIFYAIDGICGQSVYQSENQKVTEIISNRIMCIGRNNVLKEECRFTEFVNPGTVGNELCQQGVLV